MLSYQWFVVMPGGTVRCGYAWPDFRTVPPTMKNEPPPEGRRITEEQFLAYFKG